MSFLLHLRRYWKIVRLSVISDVRIRERKKKLCNNIYIFDLFDSVNYGVVKRTTKTNPLDCTH